MLFLSHFQWYANELLQWNHSGIRRLVMRKDPNTVKECDDNKHIYLCINILQRQHLISIDDMQNIPECYRESSSIISTVLLWSPKDPPSVLLSPIIVLLLNFYQRIPMPKSYGFLWNQWKEYKKLRAFWVYPIPRGW